MDGWSTIKDYEVFNQVDEEFIDVKKYCSAKEKSMSLFVIKSAKATPSIYSSTIIVLFICGLKHIMISC